MRKEALETLFAGTVIPAMPLVLNAERQLDEKKQRRLIRYYLNAGVGGLAVAVHTTQFEIRKPEINLLEPVLRIAFDEVHKFEKETSKTVVTIAGVCGPMEQATYEAQLAKAIGYDAVLLSPGGLRGHDEEYLIERTKRVAKEMPVVGFYLQPSVGGRYLSFSYWQQICNIRNVIAIKCAGFSRYLTNDVARAIAFSNRSDEIALYTGNDDSIVIDLLTQFTFEKNGVSHSVNVVGGLLGHWAVWTNAAVRMFHEILAERARGNISPKMLTLATQVTDANSAFFDTINNFKGCIAGVHEVLRRQGLLDGIWCLNPDETVSPGQAEEIGRVYKMYPHLNDDEFVRKFLQNEANQ